MLCLIAYTHYLGQRYNIFPNATQVSSDTLHSAAIGGGTRRVNTPQGSKQSNHSRPYSNPPNLRGAGSGDCTFAGLVRPNPLY